MKLAISKDELKKIMVSLPVYPQGKIQEVGYLSSVFSDKDMMVEVSDNKLTILLPTDGEDRNLLISYTAHASGGSMYGVAALLLHDGKLSAWNPPLQNWFVKASCSEITLVSNGISLSSIISKEKNAFWTAIKSDKLPDSKGDKAACRLKSIARLIPKGATLKFLGRKSKKESEAVELWLPQGFAKQFTTAHEAILWAVTLSHRWGEQRQEMAGMRVEVMTFSPEEGGSIYPIVYDYLTERMSAINEILAADRGYKPIAINSL